MLAALLDLVVPRRCAGCGAGTGPVCPTCAAALLRPPLGPTRPTPCPAGLPLVHALGPYAAPLDRLLLAHKERGALALAPLLGTALAAVVAGLAIGTGPVLLCSAPSSRGAVRQRGYDHAWRLAQQAAVALGAAGVDARPLRGLALVRRVADQGGLTSAQRAANLRGAMAAVPAAGAPVVVLDDVLTTGATLVEADRALRAAGHQVLGAAVLGATVKRLAVRPLSR